MAVRASGGLDIETLRRAIEERDVDLMLGFYAEDADGTRVLSAQTLELRDGKIARQLNVEARDE